MAQGLVFRDAGLMCSNAVRALLARLLTGRTVIASCRNTLADTDGWIVGTLVRGNGGECPTWRQPSRVRFNSAGASGISRVHLVGRGLPDPGYAVATLGKTRQRSW